MATVTLGVGTADTGTTPNTSGAFTPATNDLLVVFWQITASVQVTPTCTSSIGGFTFTQINQQTYRTDLDTHYIFVANALVSSATSQTVTVGDSGDEGTGSCITVLRIAGPTVAGSSAILKSKTNSGGSANTPATTWDAGASSASNPVISVVACGLNPPAITDPSGFSSFTIISHASPDSGTQVAYRNSGHASDTITWGSTAGGPFAVISIEVDGGASQSVVPIIQAHARRRST